MISKELKDIARWALDFALKNGASNSRVAIYTGVSTELEYRDDQVDKLQQASENSMSIELFVEGRYGTYSTNRIIKSELEPFIKKGIENTKYLAVDKYRTLPDSSRYYKGGGYDLKLCDSGFEKFQTPEKIQLMKDAVGEVLGKDERIISVASSYNDGVSSRYVITSNGFEFENEQSYYSLSADVSMKGEGDARPQAGWYDSAVNWDKLQKAGLGKTAYDRVLRKLGQQKIESGKYQMLVDNLNVGRLLSPVISALYGSSLQQKNSFLLDKLDQKVVSEKLTLLDNPHLVGARGARWCDGEGVATQKRTVFDKGVLKTYYIDTYNSNKMEVAPTIGSPSVLLFDLGTKSLDQLTANLQKGIWVTGFNGGNSNSTTGDFSFGVEGFLVENGKVVKPISEMNITGNLLTLWSNIVEIGNDERTISSWRTPSILFDDVDFSGL